MNNFAEQLKHGAGQAWESLADGWRELGSRASGALTRFFPGAEEAPPANAGDQESVDRAWRQRVLPAARWSFMAVDVFASHEKLVVRIEAPGMAQEDFQIEMTGPQTLGVLGLKRHDRERTECNYALIQCAYGTFRREIQLPVAVDVDRAKATYDAGVLRIELPRKESHPSRRIEVKTA